MSRRLLALLAAAALPAVLLPLSVKADVTIVSSAPECAVDPATHVVQELATGDQTSTELPAASLLRFVNLSDMHIIDDDASTVITGTWTEAALDPTIANGSAQRLQEELTDEVLNAMVKTINACHAESALELMMATGDLTDNATLNETRRYIDNLDGVAAGSTAYEAHCGYTTHDSRGEPKLGAGPCPTEAQAAFSIATGRMVDDAQAPIPDPNDPTYQLTPTRSGRQLAETTAAAILNGSEHVAPGLPPALRCDEAADGCGNVALDVPHFAVFGNHDGYVRGTVTNQQPFQAGFAAYGRYLFESQRELINEFFHTEVTPGPVGHGFNHVEVDRFNDADDRNDGWYAFDAAAGSVRMIVLNTIADGVREELHRHGQTNEDTGGLVTGNEVTDPRAMEKGFVDAEQLAWLDTQLAAAAAAGRPVLVFSHHPDRSFADLGNGAAVNQALGRYGNVVAHIAGHTHENIIRSCTPGDCAVGSGQAAVDHGYWRIETASLVDHPQEGRIVELFDLGEPASAEATIADRYALRLTMIRPDPSDPFAQQSRVLAEAEASCKTAATLGGPLRSGPYNQSRLETIVDNAGEAAVRGKYCHGEDALAEAAGAPTDRNTILLP